MSQGETLLAGLDEAGRGAVLGPLVVALAVFRSEDVSELARLGVADSKAFGSGTKAQRKRAELAEKIRSLAVHVDLRIASAAEVDDWVRQSSLNALERHLAESLILASPPPAVLVADGARIFGALGELFGFVVARNRADRDDRVVAAASILAKHRRDQELRAILSPLEARYGPIKGGGYPNASTRRFVEAHLAQSGRLPPQTRRTWKWGPVRAAQLDLFNPHRRRR